MSNWITVVIGVACVALFALIFIVVGIILIVRSRRDKEKAQQSQTWPFVMGKVIESRVITTVSSSDEGSTDMYKPYVKYEYAVGGTSYTGDKLKVGMTLSTSNAKSSEEAVARHPLGSDVRVYYNPANPDDSVLEQKSSTTATLVIGIILLVIGLCGGIPGLIALVASFFRISGSSIQ